ncbi:MULTISPECIES: DUF6586 family protein [Acinetobacter]|jgi:hypothetical protein|uniref:HEPN domain-containing protein n=1 Tax=Acinetobacter variabilis TaxID=70346 RepID=A0A7T7WJQ3_9GAMM|nr:MULTISPECIES: DUF6586 family protein [Acinetobacter]NHB65940.1 hypothetical protein [Acinetobacter sp. GFQ9D191M]NHB99899.1 hypothetical protein [Acinetobacter sp. GFQ9D192M]QQN88463.1 hypothetical protein IAQ69_01875 [Acinetobacter variabilis]UNW06660.1 hypothetical protein MOV98_14620 [Acinetobacter variabilis]WKT72933.1 hypothetical protein Q3F87_14090 [Acinetobacter variabilis]
MTRVARYHADRTNQKLYFARMACQQAEQTDHVQQAQAHREAAVFHLHGALLAFLQELVRYYRLNDLSPTLKSIEELMAAKGQVSPEVTVLQHLSKDGFLAELKRAYRLCQYAPEPSSPQPEDETSSNLIIKVTQTPQAWLPDTAILREWHRDLTQLIDGFRNEMVEF